MRLRVELRGKAVEVEVAPDLSSVRLDGRSYPVRVLSKGPLRVELEIAGETVVVDGWPQGSAAPPGPVDVNGERSTVGVQVVAASSSVAPSVGAPSPGSAPTAAAQPEAPPGATAVLPPMPGRVVELRVRPGETVAQGAVLLVLEAMKMRNEIVAPVNGKVLEVRVREGANVRARETMIVLGPA